VSDLWLQFGLVGVLVLLNALFAGSELALISLREGQLRSIETRSSAGAIVARLARDPNRFLATIQIGITLAGFLASASAAVSLAGPLERGLGFLGGAAAPASVVLVTLVLAYTTLVFGELAPKRLAMQRAERWAMLVARPLSALASLTRPVVWLLSASTDLVVQLLGGDPSREREAVTEEEVRHLVATQGSFSPEQRTILSGAFEVAERTLHEVLRPRPDVFTLDASAPCSGALPALVASGHTRAPVCARGSLDDVVGVVHLRDLISGDPGATTESVAAATMFLPESAGVLEALRQLQLRRTQLAVVVSEHGGAEGIVTVEDLVEELVGEIYDETDQDVQLVHREADGSVVLPGRFPAHDLIDLGIEIPQGNYATVAGFVLSRLGRVPDGPGDTIREGHWRLTVTAVDERAITEVRVTRQPATEQDADRPTGRKI
jgi:putative hemolysin